MEFHEKLQFLRKQQNWTQEQLAEKLYVSRTAVSKWELGKGYPNIESLKQLARVFEISIDELLSGEELMQAAQEENQSNLRSVYAALWGVLDAAALACVFLPLYGVPADGSVRSVNLFSFTAASAVVCALYWLMLVALVAFGVAELFLARRGRAGRPTLSLVLSAAAILLFAAAREPYAAPLLFLLFLGKLLLLAKQNKIPAKH